MLFVRVDNRLVHGQIIEIWLPYLGAKHIVVANDSLAIDGLRQQIIQLAIPPGIRIHFVSIANLTHTLDVFVQENIFIVVENCQDAAAVIALVPTIKSLNVANLHFAQGKKQLLPHVAVSEEDACILQNLSKKVTVDFRSVPTEKSRELHELIY